MAGRNPGNPRAAASETFDSAAGGKTWIALLKPVAEMGDAGGHSDAWMVFATVGISDPAGVTVLHAYGRRGFSPA